MKYTRNYSPVGIRIVDICVDIIGFTICLSNFLRMIELGNDLIASRKLAFKSYILVCFIFDNWYLLDQVVPV